MRLSVGDTIRAEIGGGMFANGKVEGFDKGVIKVRMVGGNLVEVPLRGDHTVNGIKPGELNGPQAMLKELDNAKNLSEWEKEFVGDLITKGLKRFSPAQEAMIERIHKRRVQHA